eukprot:COSAG02_NODE_7183_length_3134_cov_4.238221_3_plen_85_part_00
MSCVALCIAVILDLVEPCRSLRICCVQGDVTLRVDLATVPDGTDRPFPWEEGAMKGLCPVAVEELKRLVDRVGAGGQYRTVLGM